MMPDKREQLYRNLMATGKVGVKDIGTLEQFKVVASGEDALRELYKSLMGRNGLSEKELGSADDFCRSIAPDFTPRRKEKAPVQETRKPMWGFWDTPIGDGLERIAAGGAELGGEMYSLADKGYRIGVKPFVDLVAGKDTGETWIQKWANASYENANELRKKSDRSGGKSASEQWEEGDRWGAAGNVFLGMVEQALPLAVSSFGGLGAASKTASLARATGNSLRTAVNAKIKQGLVAEAPMAAGGAAHKYDDLGRNPETKEMPEDQKLMNAGYTFLLGTLGGIFGDPKVTDIFRKLYSKYGEKATREIVEKEIFNLLESGSQKWRIYDSSLGKGIQAAGLRMADNIMNYCTGATKEWSLMDGVAETAVTGTISAVPFEAGKAAIYRRTNDNKKTQHSPAVEKRTKTISEISGDHGFMPELYIPPEGETRAMLEKRSITLGNEISASFEEMARQKDFEKLPILLEKTQTLLKQKAEVDDMLPRKLAVPELPPKETGTSAAPHKSPGSYFLDLLKSKFGNE